MADGVGWCWGSTVGPSNPGAVDPALRDPPARCAATATALRSPVRPEADCAFVETPGVARVSLGGARYAEQPRPDRQGVTKHALHDSAIAKCPGEPAQRVPLPSCP